MTLTPEGLALLKRNEACRLSAYLDDAGVATVGWGHTGPDVLENETITQEEADMLLKRDLARFERCVGDHVLNDASDPEYSAMVCLAFNIGEDNFKKSSVLRLHNAREYNAAGRAFAMWNKIHRDGKLVTSAGLTRRRAEEAALYLSGLAIPEETGAAAVGEKPLTQSRTINGTVTAGASVGVAAALDGAKEFIGSYQDTFMSILPYAQDLKWFLFALAGAGIGYAGWARYHDRKNGLN